MLRALGWKAHREAAAEVLTIALISIAPLLLGAMVRWFQIENTILTLRSYRLALEGFLARGELFLYALAFIAVVAWTALREWPLGLRPPRVMLGVFCLLSFAIITIFYSLDIVEVTLHRDAVLTFSEIMFTVTLVFYYLATALSKIEPPDLAASLAASASSLSSELRREHDNG